MSKQKNWIFVSVEVFRGFVFLANDNLLADRHTRTNILNTRVVLAFLSTAVETKDYAVRMFYSSAA